MPPPPDFYTFRGTDDGRTTDGPGGYVPSTPYPTHCFRLWRYGRRIFWPAEHFFGQTLRRRPSTPKSSFSVSFQKICPEGKFFEMLFWEGVWRGPCLHPALTPAFSKFFGRTDLRINLSGAKFEEEADFDIHSARGPPKPAQIDENLTFRSENFADTKFSASKNRKLQIFRNARCQRFTPI